VSRSLTVTTRNALFQQTRAVATNRTARHRERAFIVEGVRALSRALDHGWAFNAIWYQRHRDLSEWARDLIARAQPATVVAAAPELMSELSEREETSELIAVIGMPPDDLSRISLDAEAIVVIVDRPSSPGNLGSLIRSADAFGARGVVVLGHAVDPYEAAAVRATQGSLFAVPVVRLNAADDVRAWLGDSARRVRVIGTDSAAEVAVWDADLAPPMALVLGNETAGMSAAVRAMCDAVVRIPMTGTADSLNLASAGTVLLYEAFRGATGPRS
jgi:23S rRNA (uridine2479-2'-O)-methyltransferase